MHRDPVDLAIYFLGFLLAWNVATAVRTKRYRVIVRGLRPVHLVRGSVILGVTAVIAVLLISAGGAFEVGWWQLIGGHGNAVLLDAGDETHRIHLAPFVAVVGLILVAPIAAHREERWFRRGSEGWSWPRRSVRALAFGLSHLVLGVPLGAAIAIAAAGGGFQAAYVVGYAARQSRHDAVLSSTRIHLAYNLVALSLVGAALLAAR